MVSFECPGSVPGVVMIAHRLIFPAPRQSTDLHDLYRPFPGSAPGRDPVQCESTMNAPKPTRRCLLRAPRARAADTLRAGHGGACRTLRRQSLPSGFTVIELVVVLALVGILSFVALSRMSSTDAFAHRSATDSLAGAMRYAQKRAIAGRTTIWVRLDPTAGTVLFCRDSAPACAQPLAEPGAQGALAFQAPPGVALSVVPSGATAFSFDGLGRAVGPTAASADVVLDSAAATAVVRTWTETGLTETVWTPK